MKPDVNIVHTVRFSNLLSLLLFPKRFACVLLGENFTNATKSSLLRSFYFFIVHKNLTLPQDFSKKTCLVKFVLGNSPQMKSCNGDYCKSQCSEKSHQLRAQFPVYDRWTTQTMSCWWIPGVRRSPIRIIRKRRLLPLSHWTLGIYRPWLSC